MNFYQSGLRKHITKEIYQKPTFEIELFGKTYQGIMKQQRRLGKDLRRYMVHGVELGDLKEYSVETKTLLGQLQRDYKRGRGDILFQIGSIDILDSRSTIEVKNTQTKDELRQKRLYQQSDLWQRYSLKPSWREHMPDATQILNISDAPDRSGLSDSGKRYVNKGKKAGLDFVVATKKEQREAYRDMRYKMGYDKSLAVVPKDKFLALMNYLSKEKKGELFVAMKGDQVVSGALYVYYGKQLIYLYGATDRSFGNIGAQYRLTWEIINRGHSQGRSSIDLLGVSPVGFEDGHDLQGVTRFKQSFGGETISYVGNYDLIFNQTLYKVMKKLKGK